MRVCARVCVFVCKQSHGLVNSPDLQHSPAQRVDNLAGTDGCQAYPACRHQLLEAKFIGHAFPGIHARVAEVADGKGWLSLLKSRTLLMETGVTPYQST